MDKAAAPEEKKQDGRRKPQRKVEILQAVMSLLESGEKVTTAGLAERLKLSEAALYRHFRGKGAIFETLAAYIEDHLMRPINRLGEERESAAASLERLMAYHLRFFEEHPGLCRVFLVEGVAHETPEIRERMVRVVGKYTAQVKQILRRGQAEGELPESVPVAAAAQMFVGILQYRALAYVSSGFKEPPSRDADAAWVLFCRAVRLRE